MDGVAGRFDHLRQRQCVDYTGCPREANYDCKWVELVHPDDVERAAAGVGSRHRTETAYTLDYRIRRFDGVYRWHSLPRAAGARIGWRSAHVDRHRHRHRGPEAARTFVATLGTGGERDPGTAARVEAAAPVGFKLVDRDLRIVRINETLARINGLSVAEQLGRTVAEIAPELWPQLEDIYRRALRRRDRCATGRQRRRARPSRCDTRHWLASYYPVRVDGEIIGVGNVVVDITERKEAEEFRGVVMDNMAEGLYALDADGRVTYMNRAASQMLGWTEQELLGRPMHETIHFQRADGTPVPADECALSARPDQRPSRPDRRRSLHPQGRHDLPGRLLRRAAAERRQRSTGSSWSSATSPRRRRSRPASSASWPRSAGSDASATPSTRTASSCTPSPSCRSPAAGRAKSCCCA